MRRLGQFIRYCQRVFGLSHLAGGVKDGRPFPQVPMVGIWLSLVLGAVMRVPSFLQLEAETARACWQRWIGQSGKISDDVFDYATERMDLDNLRSHLVLANKTLKRNKAFEGNKIGGLLVASLDANEQFKSRSRCCPECLQREIKIKDSEGHEQTAIEYYHKQVYCQISGPHLSTILDLEPQRAGEEEGATALRLLTRIRESFGPRFFDVVVLDAWYAKGPVLNQITQWGWGLVVVLKRQEYHVWKESEALTRGTKPLQEFKHEQRQVQLWEVKDLDFSESTKAKVRVVRSHETFEEVQQIGGKRQRVAKEQNWRWVVNEVLSPYGAKIIWQIGHCRWKIENNAFNELTQAWHLEHCFHHHPVSVLALLLITVFAFTLFKAFAQLNGKMWRAGKATLQELRLQIYRALEVEPVVIFFSSA